MKPTQEELDTRFTYHETKPGQLEKYLAIRAMTKQLAELMVKECPESRELSLALTELEQSNMWANAAIARRS